VFSQPFYRLFFLLFSSNLAVLSFLLEPLNKAWIPRPFSAELLPYKLVPSLYCCMGLFSPKSRTLHLSLLSIVVFPLTSSFFQILQIPLNHSFVLQHIELFSGFVVMHQTDEGALLLLLRSLIKMFNSAASKTDP